jgi:predicted enzyme related to lactoylglutathione lyase
MRFAGVCLITGDVLRLSGFYMDVLGVGGEGDHNHMDLKAHGTSLAIFSADGMEEMAPGSMQGAGYGSFTINFEVEDVDSEYEKIVGRE